MHNLSDSTDLYDRWTFKSRSSFVKQKLRDMYIVQND